MKRTVLDSSILISYWMKYVLFKKSDSEVRAAARNLINLLDTNAIVTPVYVECVCGSKTGNELRLMRAFLNEFNVIDKGHVSDADWKKARSGAERIPSDGKPRQLGDCLIKAIADRFNYDVLPIDKRFAR